MVDDKGEPVRPLAWKDTVNVPMKTTVRLLVTFDERPGEWMFHCHILDHADGGLMGTVKRWRRTGRWSRSPHPVAAGVPSWTMRTGMLASRSNNRASRRIGHQS